MISSNYSIAQEFYEEEPLDNFQLQVYLTAGQALRLVFPQGTEIVEDTIVLTKEGKYHLDKRLRRRLFEDRFKVYIGKKKGKVQGYAIITEEIGKFHPFTFLVGVKPNGKIKQIAVLVYRESRGSEIARKRFLYQFVGKKTKHPIRINKDIINITGATMSVNAMCAGVRKALAVVDEFYISGKRNPLLMTLPLYKPDAEKKFAEQKGQTVPGTETTITITEARIACCTERHLLMGTIAEITAYGDNIETVRNAINLAFSEINRLDNLMSTYKEESEMSRVNREATKGPTTCDDELLNIIEDSLRYSALTDGAFDITVGPLMKLWQFRKSKGVNGRPNGHAFFVSQEELNAVMPAVSYKNIVIFPRKKRISFKNPHTQLDLGGIGKGYAVDRAFDVLKKNGITSACINFGGNIRVMGSPPGRGGWKIAVQHPRQKDAVLGYLELTNGAISTSGDYEKFLTINGKRYSHIIDPRNGKPVEGMMSVTLLAKTATQADVLSTSVFVMNLKEGLKLIEKLGGIEAILIYEGKDSRYHQKMSKGFSRLFHTEGTKGYEENAIKTFLGTN
jgi:thiamine biosynthesis lipoprotein ApbE/Na+-translocating ferredoxin:NAD+ oxidoreductase RnfG subunit